MKDIIYHLSCGCILNRQEIAFDNTTITCPVHPGAKVIKRQGNCIVCGKTIFQKARGEKRLYCAACKKEKIKEAYQKNNLKVSKRAEPISSKRYPNCKHYDECLNKISHTCSGTFSCEGCIRYEHADLNVMDYAIIRDSFQPAVSYA